MKKLIVISLAGILAASVPGAYAGAADTTFHECKASACFVEISVVEVGGVKTVVANHEILLVAHRGPDKFRRSATIIFNLTTEGYKFVDKKGIEFADKVEFVRENESSHSKRVVMNDKNSKDVPKYSSYKYTIQVQDTEGGDPIVLDPVVINGGGTGH